MRTLVGLGALEPPSGGSAVTIGTFDGVHIGHRALISATVADAARAGLASVVVTWDRHPSATLRPGHVPPLLCAPDRKVELIGDTGVDALAILPFDEALARWPPERFVDEVLVSGLGARRVRVGAGWRFGHRAAGDVAVLQRLGTDLGFEVAAAPLTEANGGAVSSTRIRDAVAAGDLERVHSLLARPFELQGVVVHGDHRGKSMGYPTANLALAEGLALPPLGVYAGEAVMAGRTRHRAAVSVGVNPTFGGEAGAPPRVEAHVLDFDGDLYGQVLRIEFHRRLREERRFHSVDELVAQMARDVEETRALSP